jgi:GDPmannose 4,6-dehydratase
MATKKALITGITGQDGSYLAEILIAKGYEVHGIIRRSSSLNTGRLDEIYKEPHVANPHLYLHYGDLADANTIRKLIYEIGPEEIYNLAAQSHVRISFDIPEFTANITGLGTLRILEAIKDYEENTGRKTKFYQASSSEMFGAAHPPQNEGTKFHPRSPYGIAKVFAFETTRNYREAYGIFAVNGILFNHESERRGHNFVSHKITTGIARIIAGIDKKLYLGNLSARRDWGYAPEYCEAMYLMLQKEIPDDYVIGTGTSHSVEEFVEKAFSIVGMDWKEYVEIDPRYYRPSEVDDLIADSRKAERELGWKAKTTFDELIRIMLRHDLRVYNLNDLAEKI